MKTILIVICFCVVVFTISNLIFLLSPLPQQTIKDGGCDCGKEEDRYIEPKQKSLISSLKRLGINHNTKSLADHVLKENPDTEDLEELITLTLKKIRENYQQKI